MQLCADPVLPRCQHFWCKVALTIGWTALIAWDEVSSGKHEGILETAIAVGSKAGTCVSLVGAIR